jgi:DNA-binding NarL/FixJ family response regulator
MPYYQLSHRKRNTQGIGMGLNIVKKIIDEVNGTIELESSPGRGTTFTLTFTGIGSGEGAHIVDEDMACSVPVYRDTGRETALVDGEAHDGRPVVLVVDDNKDIVAYLQKKLRADYNVFYALSGRGALEKIRKMPKPDLIISDIMMDDMDGYAFRDALVSLGNYRTIPFIFLTALTATAEKIKGMRQGAIDFISKPFHMDELRAKIDSIVDIQKALAKENLAGLRRRLYRHLKVLERTTGKPGAVSDQGEDRKKRLFRRYGISQQQIAIIALLKCGLLRKEISDRLDISINTVNTQIRRMFEKCRVHNKTELLNIFD